jgi:outer membrane protein assembly factor BamB
MVPSSTARLALATGGIWLALLAPVVACGARSGLDLELAAPSATPDGGTGDAPVPPPRDCSYGGAPGAPWPMAGRCPDQRGTTPAVGPNAARTKWTYAGAAPIDASAVIGADGTIYVGSTNGSLYALTPDGSVRWSTAAGIDIEAAAALGADGLVYVVTSTSRQTVSLVALGAATGAPSWTVTIGQGSAAQVSAPVLGPEGNVYVATEAGIQAFSSGGVPLWTYGPYGNADFAPPTVAADGTLFFGLLTSPPRAPVFVALDAAGNPTWTANSPSNNRGGLALGQDGTLYGCGEVLPPGSGEAVDQIFALAATGAVAWTQTPASDGWGCQGTPAVGPGGNVVFPLAFLLDFVTGSGDAVWAHPFSPAFAVSTPAIGGDGTVYVGTPTGVTAFAPSGATTWSYATGSAVTAPAIGADGTVYVTTQDGRVIAIGD